ncbi:MAG: hypothetical protein K9H58_17990 [Bacteroidales bacterium]|nr:hypothetical protein [Bacteroidales bacterium]
MAAKSNNNKIFTKQTDVLFPFQFVFIGYLMIPFGFYLLYGFNYWGILSIVIGIFISFSKTGVQVDFTKNIFREYLSVFNLRYGKWIKLPGVKYVTVFVDRSIQEMHMKSISSVQQNADLKINLIFSKTSKLGMGTFKNKDEALEVGKLLASSLQTRLLDYTSGKANWVDQSSEE